MLRNRRALGTVAYMGGVPTVPEPFAWSWGQMVQYNAEVMAQGMENNSYIHYDRAQSSYHVYARNTLVKRMVGDWIFMLDTDIRFDPDIAERMLRTMEQYNFVVLTGLYIHKRYPRLPVLYHYNEEQKKNEIIATWDKNEPFRIDAAGGGCLLVKKVVFDLIKQELNEDPFTIIPPLSEDLSFFDRLKRLEVEAYVDPRIEVNHLAYEALSYEEDADIKQVDLGKAYVPNIPAT